MIRHVMPRLPVRQPRQRSFMIRMRHIRHRPVLMRRAPRAHLLHHPVAVPHEQRRLLRAARRRVMLRHPPTERVVFVLASRAVRMFDRDQLVAAVVPIPRHLRHFRRLLVLRRPRQHFHYAQQVVRPALAALLRFRQRRLRRQRHRPRDAIAMPVVRKIHRTIRARLRRKPQQAIAARFPRLDVVPARRSSQQVSRRIVVKRFRSARRHHVRQPR
ncbi:hypothetical protein FEP70_05636 [Burkholderia multivorans]|nr:hypothetical protein [Burkholderia multivorans]MDR8915033.1 hypothetical protein [Burkholderia multivorans]MDR8951279.1 hypothetical protein [Burkholderia multivorans]MDR8987686.1 hypothetical protein [Burkholderia multivorans]MDR9048449.1 hypothetical protein [Burkholderia multivorans]